MKKTAILLFMLFVFVSKAQETFYIGESVDKAKSYIYTGTVRESEIPGYITTWILKEYSTPQKLSNDKYYMKIKIQYLINCKYNKYGTIKVIFYSKNDDFIYDSESVDEYLVQLDSAAPGYRGEMLIQTACRIYESISNQKQE